MDLQFEPILYAISIIVLYVVIFFLSKWIKGLFSPFNLDEELTERDNVAVAVSASGYFAGITIIFVAAHSGPITGLVEDLISTSAWSLAGILLLNLSRVINDRLILYKFTPVKEMIREHNVGTGVIEAGAYIASALVIGGSIHGEGGGPETAIVFYLIGQICLVLFGILYRRLTPYSLREQIEQKNTAAGLGFAGGLISIGIIIMRAVSGHFTGWAEDLSTLVLDIGIIFIYLIAVRLIFDKLILRNSDLNTEIANDKNLGAGLLEMVVSICFSVALFYVL